MAATDEPALERGTIGRGRKKTNECRLARTSIWNYLVAFGVPALILSLIANGLTESVSTIQGRAKAYRNAITVDTVAAYSTFLDTHPTGRRANEAEGRKALAVLRDFETMDHEIYTLAQNADSIAAYTIYLKLYRAGASNRNAQENIRRLQADQQAFEAARSNNTIASYDDYLRAPSPGQRVFEARYWRQIRESQMIDNEAYLTALDDNEPVSYRSYLMAFPHGHYKHEVEESLRILESDYAAYIEASNERTIAACDRYLKTYKAGRYASEIEDLKRYLEAALKELAAYKFATEIDDIPAYRAFLVNYPNGEHADAAKRRFVQLEADDLAFSAAKSIGTVGAYKQYLSTYPDGRHRKEASLAKDTSERRRLDDLAYSHARELNTQQSFLAYIMHYPEGRHLEEARADVSRLRKLAAGGGTVEAASEERA